MNRDSIHFCLRKVLRRLFAEYEFRELLHIQLIHRYSQRQDQLQSSLWQKTVQEIQKVLLLLVSNTLKASGNVLSIVSTFNSRSTLVFPSISTSIIFVGQIIFFQNQKLNRSCYSSLVIKP
ncbi:unnamed protein product [Albugo candida]|uniref:Uncharacterized protein n=1 Tax=Albugo candida TaxID=65357 RepID=A0A024FTX2_9STRA|nr:unnamed protein product [Albugo candida]|eukprot:CCI10565.1 unnamed protein product [Albugo candida]